VAKNAEADGARMRSTRRRSTADDADDRPRAALRPAYEKISRRFYENPDQFADAFARAWFKLTHRDMGPRVRYLGKLVPKEELIWQDPIPRSTTRSSVTTDIAALKAKILASGLTVSELVSTAWASASTFRGSDKRGGANGARIRLAPQKDWEVNQPAQLAKVLRDARGIQKDFNVGGGKKISLADLIVLAGVAAVEKAAKDAGVDVKVPFTPGRMDASQEQTDVASFAPLEPRATASATTPTSKKMQFMAPEEALVDRAQLLRLTGPEMTVLLGGLRVLGANAGGSKHGVLTTTGQADERLLRQPARHEHAFGSRPARTPTRAATARRRRRKWTATRVDLIFGSHSQLRAFAEVYACATRSRSS
jgi:catalase-peroxidase